MPEYQWIEKMKIIAKRNFFFGFVSFRSGLNVEYKEKSEANFTLECKYKLTS